MKSSVSTPPFALERTVLALESRYFDCNSGEVFSSLRDVVGYEVEPTAITGYVVFGDNTREQLTYLKHVGRIPLRGAYRDGVVTPSPPLGEFPLVDRSPAALATELWAQLRAAVARAIGDAPEIVVDLSGGLDSVALAIAAVELVGRSRVRGVTLGFLTDFEDPEPKLAQDVARYLGIEWDFVQADTTRAVASWPHVDAFPTLPSTAMTVAQEALRPERGVVISGVGGDSLQRGDRAHYRTRLREGAWHRAVGDVWLALVHGVRPGFGLTRWTRPPGVWSAPDWIRPDAPGLDEIVQDRREWRARWPRGIDELLSDVWSDMFDRYASYNTGTSWDYVYPFFDEQLARFWATIPTIPWAVAKEALRAALRGRCPEQIRLRPKTLLAGEQLVEITEDCLAQLHGALDTDLAERWFDAEAIAATLHVGVHRYSDVHDAIRCASVARWLKRRAER